MSNHEHEHEITIAGITDEDLRNMEKVFAEIQQNHQNAFSKMKKEIKKEHEQKLAKMTDNERQNFLFGQYNK